MNCAYQEQCHVCLGFLIAMCGDNQNCCCPCKVAAQFNMRYLHSDDLYLVCPHKQQFIVGGSTEWLFPLFLTLSLLVVFCKLSHITKGLWFAFPNIDSHILRHHLQQLFRCHCFHHLTNCLILRQPLLCKFRTLIANFLYNSSLRLTTPLNLCWYASLLTLYYLRIAAFNAS